MNSAEPELLAITAPSSTRLEIVTLCAGYGQRDIVHDVSLSLQRGELAAIIGPNGAGKSTLLKAVIGLASVNAGAILFDGVDIGGWAPHERAQKGIAYVLQGGSVFPGLDVRQNLDAATSDLSPDNRTQGIEQTLVLFSEFEMDLSRRAGLLSGGERQLLALAMIIARRPKILLLDEPLAGLSPRYVDLVASKIATICRNWGTTVLLVEQNVRAALSMADRAVLLDRGKIVGETDNPSEWISGGHLERMLWRQSSSDD